MLSPVDAVAGHLASFQAKANDENFSERLYIEGEILERWVLKVAVNSAAAGWMGPVKLLPEPEIVAAIFGFSVVPDGLGLHAVDGLDPSHSPSGGVAVTPIMFNRAAGSMLAGAYVAVHGLTFFVAFARGLVNQIEEGVDRVSNRVPYKGLRHSHHPGALVISRERGPPVIIGLSWNGLIRFDDGTTVRYPPLILAAASDRS